MSKKALNFQKVAMLLLYRGKVCNSLRRKPKVHDPEAPYDGYDERDDTEEKARTVRLEKQRML